MNEYVYFHSLNDCFNHNIEMLRDASDVIGTGNMVNAYDRLSFAITNSGRLVIMIDNRRRTNTSDTIVCVEFQGDGMMTIYQTDCFGNKINDRSELFDTHSYTCNRDGCHEAFKKLLKSKFDVTI